MFGINWHRVFFVWAPIALVIFYIVSDPTGAAAQVNEALGVLKDAAIAFIVFFRNIF